jgi:hypothetical protein
MMMDAVVEKKSFSWQPLRLREIGALDATSIKALKEYLPTVDERNQLQSYLKAAGDSKDIREKLYGDLSDCEKYMICMMDIAKADDHFDCMLFRVQFRSRFDELIDCLRTVDKACDEVRSSEKFRQIMAIILTVVNQINTGGEGKGQAMGFNLETLLKLNEVRLCCLVIGHFCKSHFSTQNRRRLSIKRQAFFNISSKWSNETTSR